MDQKDERYNGQRRKYLSDLSQDLTICRKSSFKSVKSRDNYPIKSDDNSWLKYTKS